MVEDEAKALALRGISPADYEGRSDLRNLPIFTIDSAESKDLDDAVSVSRTADGYLLGVHIADVSHYVQEGKPLDTEAFPPRYEHLFCRPRYPDASKGAVE